MYNACIIYDNDIYIILCSREASSVRDATRIIKAKEAFVIDGVDECHLLTGRRLERIMRDDDDLISAPNTRV